MPSSASSSPASPPSLHDALPIYQPLRHGTRFGDTEVQRMVGRLGKQSVRVDHERNVRSLDGDLHVVEVDLAEQVELVHRRGHQSLDRKSTRLNSSHRCISYAVFCLVLPGLATFPTRRSSDLSALAARDPLR